MADDITVSIGVDDSALSQAVAKIKANIAELAEGAKIASAGMKQFGLTPEAMLPGLSGASKRALESYMAAQKLPPLPPGGGGGGGPSSAEIVKTKEAVHGLVEEFGGLAMQFVKWGLIWQAFDAGIKAVGEAYKQFTAEADVARQAANSFGGTLEAGQEYLRIYRDAQHETSMSWDDWQKFAPPAIHALEGVGMSARDAMGETAHLGQIFEDTGADLRKLAPVVDLGTASFSQLSEAVRLMGPAWATQLDALQHIEAAEKDYQRDLAHTHTLEQQAEQDAERLSSTRESFAEKTGIAAAAYKDFARTGRAPGAMGGADFLLYGQGGGAQLPAWANVLGAQDRAAMRTLTREHQQMMSEGVEQIAKEMGISVKGAQALVRSGAPGFDEKSLMAAHDRAVKEYDVSQERDYQEANYQRTKGLEDERVKMNTELRDRLQEQNKFLEAQPNLINKTKDAFVDWAHDFGAETGKIEAKLPVWATALLALSGLEGLAPVLPGLKGVASPIAPGGTLPKLNVHDQEGSDKITGKIDELLRMLEGGT